MGQARPGQNKSSTKSHMNVHWNNCSKLSFAYWFTLPCSWSPAALECRMARFTSGIFHVFSSSGTLCVSYIWCVYVITDVVFMFEFFFLLTNSTKPFTHIKRHIVWITHASYQIDLISRQRKKAICTAFWPDWIELKRIDQLKWESSIFALFLLVFFLFLFNEIRIILSN